MILLLLACGTEPTPAARKPAVWTQQAVHGATITTLEPGGEEIGPDAWARVMWMGPDFENADVDGSRGIGVRELSGLLRSQDPLNFDERRERGALDREAWAAPFSAPAAQRATFETLAFVRDETRHLEPGARLPDDEALRTLAAGGSLDADEVQGVLVGMRAVWTRHDRVFPEGLIE